MSDFMLTCCSTADMPLEYYAQRNIPFVCFHYVLDGVEYLDDVGQSVPYDEFYARIAAGSMPTTSQVNVDEFIAFWTPFLEEGKDVLHISFSSGLSGSYGSACIARDELAEQYPARQIFVVDSLAASPGYGLLVDMAADRRDAGENVQAVYRWAEDHKLNLQQYCTSTDLTHYKRGGRISATSAFVGTLLNICPIVKMSTDGHLTPYAKVRGKKHALNAMLKRMEEYAENRLAYAGKCFMCHSACYDDARYLADEIEKTFPNLAAPVMISNIGTVIGAHTGPGTVGLFFYGDRRVD